jgi:hypothetical protein
MIINWLGKIPEGKIINKIASGIDLLPTLKDLAGIMSQPKIELDGVSLKPLIMNEKPKWKERYIYNYWRGKLSLRSQKYRLDHKGQLFDMIEDPNQTTDISNQKSQVLNKLFQAKEKWLKTVRVELPEKDERPFYIGHPSLQSTQIPARDGNPIGEIIRSNRFPNDTYFTNWINLEDSITWEAEVLQDGDFEVVIYYTCAEDAVGSKFELSFGKSKLIGKINKYHDPEEFGKNRDRSPRIESYTKDFIPLNIGKIRLKKGVGTLKLKGIKKTGKQLMDFRLLMLKRV